MGTDLFENSKSEMIGCKISVLKRLGRVRTGETGMTQAQEIKTFTHKKNATMLI